MKIKNKIKKTFIITGSTFFVLIFSIFLQFLMKKIIGIETLNFQEFTTFELILEFIYFAVSILFGIKIGKDFYNRQKI